MLRSNLGDSELSNIRTEVLHEYAVAALVGASNHAPMSWSAAAAWDHRPRPIGFGQQRCGPPCAVPSRDRPCGRSTVTRPHFTGPARHRRIARFGDGHCTGVR